MHESCSEAEGSGQRGGSGDVAAVGGNSLATAGFGWRLMGEDLEDGHDSAWWLIETHSHSLNSRDVYFMVLWTRH